MNWSLQVRDYMKEHLLLYIFVSVLFMMGIIFGALLVNALSLEQRQELSQFMGSFFHMIDQGGGFQEKAFFQQTFGMHLKWMLLIWLAGLSVIGFPFILVLVFLKGILIGFTVGYLVGQLSWDGMLFALVSIAPQNLIIIPVIMICSVSGISFAIYLIKNRLFLRKSVSIYKPFMNYSFVTVTLIFMLFGVSLFETFITPLLMEWVTPTLLVSLN